MDWPDKLFVLVFMHVFIEIIKNASSHSLSSLVVEALSLTVRSPWRSADTHTVSPLLPGVTERDNSFDPFS